MFAAVACKPTASGIFHFVGRKVMEFMMMVLKRKQLVVAVLAVLVGVAGYVNISRERTVLTEEEDMQVSSDYLGEARLVDSESVADYFAQARIDREAGRSKSIETFNALISNEDADPETRETAQQGVLALAQNTETETAVENLIRAKGFEDAVCYINNGSANVVVRAESIDSTDAAIISEIVTEQSGIPVEKIKIVELN